MALNDVKSATMYYSFASACAAIGGFCAHKRALSGLFAASAVNYMIFRIWSCEVQTEAERQGNPRWRDIHSNKVGLGASILTLKFGGIGYGLVWAAKRFIK